jgi:hypothetical protein
METHVTGQTALGELRQALSAVLFGNPLFSPQEQLLANHRIYECEDAQQLTRWLTNTSTALTRRQLVRLSPTSSGSGHVV